MFKSLHFPPEVIICREYKINDEEQSNGGQASFQSHIFYDIQSIQGILSSLRIKSLCFFYIIVKLAQARGNMSQISLMHMHNFVHLFQLMMKTNEINHPLESHEKFSSFTHHSKRAMNYYIRLIVLSI